MNKYIEILNKAEEVFNSQLNQVAETYRTSVLIPLCRRHKLEYFSGNGDYFFDRAPPGKSFSDRGYISSIEFARDFGLNYLVPVFETLDHICADRFPFGYAVRTVRQSDYQEKT